MRRTPILHISFLHLQKSIPENVHLLVFSRLMTRENTQICFAYVLFVEYALRKVFSLSDSVIISYGIVPCGRPNWISGSIGDLRRCHGVACCLVFSLWRGHGLMAGPDLMSGGQSLYSLVVYGLSVIGSIRKFYSILGVFGTQFRFFLPHIQICRSSRTSKEFTHPNREPITCLLKASHVVTVFLCRWLWTDHLECCLNL